jgi:hypothetical protein
MRWSQCYFDSTLLLLYVLLRTSYVINCHTAYHQPRHGMILLLSRTHRTHNQARQHCIYIIELLWLVLNYGRWIGIEEDIPQRATLSQPTESKNNNKYSVLSPAVKNCIVAGWCPCQWCNHSCDACVMSGRAIITPTYHACHALPHTFMVS